MAAYQKLANLAYRLHLKTVNGSIDWKETVTVGVYQASFANYSIQIFVKPSELHEGEDVKISVIGEEGNEIESFLDVDIQFQWLQDLGGTDPPYAMMHETYEIARRSALGTEEAINKILSELEDDDPLSKDVDIPF